MSDIPASRDAVERVTALGLDPLRLGRLITETIAEARRRAAEVALLGDDRRFSPQSSISRLPRLAEASRA